MAFAFDEVYKRARDEPDAEKIVLNISKKDDERKMVFGWASVAALADGSPVLDRQGDYIEIDTLENAVYQYVLTSRSGGEMHERKNVAVMVESVVFTPEKMSAIGIKKGVIPYGWWIGLKITDDDVWAKVKSGKYKMFSIEGRAKRVEVEDKEIKGV